MLLLATCQLPLAAPAFALADDPLAIGAPQYLFQLTYADAEDAIGRMLAEKGAGAKIAATIEQRKSGGLFSYSQPLSVEVRGLQFDKEKGHWSASLVFISQEKVISAMAVSGHYEEMLEVPVLKREVVGGTVINNEDVELRDFPLARTRSDTITDMAELIGKSPVRTISPDRPIREHEIASPALVKKNTIVEMRYDSPGMEITTTGQALDEGAKGSVISVRNTASKKIVRAVVADAGTVDILPAGELVSQVAETEHAAN